VSAHEESWVAGEDLGARRHQDQPQLGVPAREVRGPDDVQRGDGRVNALVLQHALRRERQAGAGAAGQGRAAAAGPARQVLVQIALDPEKPVEPAAAL